MADEWHGRNPINCDDLIAIALGIAPWALFFAAVTYLSGLFAESTLLAPEWITRTYATLVVKEGAKPGSPAAKAYWNTCVTSMVHGMIVPAMVMIAVRDDGLLDDPGNFFKTSPTARGVGAGTVGVYHVFLGYILVDTLQLLIHRSKLPGWALIAVHHSVCIHSYMSMLLFDFCHLLGLMCILTEITAPFMQGSILMKKCGLHATKPTAFAIVGAGTIITWTGAFDDASPPQCLPIAPSPSHASSPDSYLASLSYPSSPPAPPRTYAVVRIVCMGWVGSVLYSPSYFAQMAATNMLWSVAIPMLAGYGMAYYLQWHWYVKILQGAFRLICPSVCGGGKGKTKKSARAEQ